MKSTFLNEELKEDISVEQLSGFIVEDYETKVSKLKKTLYRFKASTGESTWYSEIDGYSIVKGFMKSKNESKIGGDFGIIIVI